MATDKLIAQYRLELTVINALNKIIHNYRREDIDYLQQNRSFAHAWDYYWDGYRQTVTILLFWETWADKFDHATQAFVLDYALHRYGEEAYRAIYRRCPRLEAASGAAAERAVPRRPRLTRPGIARLCSGTT